MTEEKQITTKTRAKVKQWLFSFACSKTETVVVMAKAPTRKAAQPKALAHLKSKGYNAKQEDLKPVFKPKK